jgi:1-deoxy-D-xylulose 5-phosphate reductoisomerase
MTPQVVIDDANNAVQALGAAVTNLAISQPTLIPAAVVTSIKTYTADAASILATLSASVAATQGATVLNQVAADLQAVLNALAGIPGLPSQVTTIAAAASVVLPFIVAFVQQYIPASAGPAVKVGISAAAMPLSQARATLAAAAK